MPGRRRALLTWGIVEALIHAECPDIASVSTERLAAWLDDGPPLLLDVRTPEEYAVSHLPGAVRVDPKAAPEALTAEVTTRRGSDGGQRVVVYCSVGIRSARVADRLRRAGVGSVYNLDGSIFRWASEGRPVVRDGAPVRAVHPYNALWGRLLPRGLHPG